MLGSVYSGCSATNCLIVRQRRFRSAGCCIDLYSSEKLSKMWMASRSSQVTQSPDMTEFNAPERAPGSLGPGRAVGGPSCYASKPTGLPQRHVG